MILLINYAKDFEVKDVNNLPQLRRVNQIIFKRGKFIAMSPPSSKMLSRHFRPYELNLGGEAT